jgi:hypothetical protein
MTGIDVSFVSEAKLNDDLPIVINYIRYVYGVDVKVKRSDHLVVTLELLGDKEKIAKVVSLYNQAHQSWKEKQNG